MLRDNRTFVPAPAMRGWSLARRAAALSECVCQRRVGCLYLEYRARLMSFSGPAEERRAEERRVASFQGECAMCSLF